MIAMARRFYADVSPDISSEIHDGANPAEDMPPPSLWRAHNSHPVKVAAEKGAVWTYLEKDDVHTELRPGVGIRQKTGARAGKVLYDMECVPAGTHWSFLLEIATGQRDSGFERKLSGPVAEGMAVRVLKHWTEGRCWLGGSVARGLGWLRLKDARLIRVADEHWPDSSAPPEVVLGRLVERFAAENRVCKDDDLWSIARRAPATRTWHFIDIEGRFAAGDDPDGYGLDPLAVGGHPGNSVLTHFDAGSYGRPRGIKEKAFEDAYSTDRPLAMTKGTDGRMRPFLPGASLRGPLRHALSRAHRARGTDVSDPNVSHDKPGQPGEIFGTIEQSARLLVRDAEVLDDGWQAVRMQHHAEDEFAAGPYGSAKFDATVLLEASFGWRMVLEGNNEIELAEWKAAVKSLLGDDADLTGLGTLGHLPVGGLKWRGAGWGRWCVEKIEQVDEQAEPGTAPSDTSDTVASRKDSGAASTDAAQSTYPNARAALDEVKRIVASLEVDLDIERDSVSEEELTFAEVAKAVKPGDHCVSWWVEPRANPADIGRPRPVCFGWGVPPTEDFALDEARVSFADGAWHAVRQRKGYRWVRLRETAKSDAAGKPISYAKTQLVALRSDIGRFGWDKGETFKTPKQHDRIKVTAYIRDGRTLGFRWEEV